MDTELASLRLKLKAWERLPFCPDHRDKVSGKTCRECEIERLHRLIVKARKIIHNCIVDPNVVSQWLDDTNDIQQRINELEGNV